MKRIMLILVMASLAADLFGQTDQKVQKQMEQIDKKAKRDLEYSTNKQYLIQLAENRDLVLEATSIYGRHGYNATVTQNNFILIDSTHFVMQTSAPNYVGQNGMGGVTIRGTITSYDVKPGKEKQPVVITAQVNTLGLGGATLIIRLPNPDNCSAIFTTNLGGTLTFTGPVTSVQESSVYKGMNMY